MDLICNDDGVPYCANLFKLVLPPYLHPILLDFINAVGIRQLCRHCIATQPRSFTTECSSPGRWNVRIRPLTGDKSVMYWISPADLATHNNLLSYLAVGGLATVLCAMSCKSASDVTHFTVFQATFILVSRYSVAQFHADFDDTLVGRCWSVIIPIELVNGSDSELLIHSHHSNSGYYAVRYCIGEAVIFAPDVIHSTAVVDYAEGYRLCLSLNVACISEANAHLLLPDITLIHVIASCGNCTSIILSLCPVTNIEIGVVRVIGSCGNWGKWCSAMVNFVVFVHHEQLRQSGAMIGTFVANGP